MSSRQTIHYTVELLQNGNFNIYEGDACYRHTLRWGNVTPVGTAEILGSWVITWAENEKAHKEESK